MANKSILKRLEVDVALKSHDCQHNANHRVSRGDKRLKLWKERSPEHFCVKCAMEMIERDIARMQAIQLQLQVQSEAASDH